LALSTNISTRNKERLALKEKGVNAIIFNIRKNLDLLGKLQ
jgi:hypothetical protein